MSEHSRAPLTETKLVLSPQLLQAAVSTATFVPFQSPAHPRPTPPHAQGMNYLAGFVLATLADGVVSEREGAPASSSREPSSAGSNGSTTTTNSASPPGGSPPPNPRKDPLEQAGAVAGSNAGKEKGGATAGAGPTAAEISLIEGECVQVMQGIIVLQGGVLSRDLWGLHAVSGRRAEGGLPEGCSDSSQTW